MDYSGYPEYEQLHPPFMHHVSIIDLLLNCGPEAAYYIWGWRDVAYRVVPGITSDATDRQYRGAKRHV